MNRLFLEKNLQHLLFQRNFLVAICSFLAISLMISISFSFFKNERVIIVPPIVEKEFWVESNAVSPTYLEQFGCFLGQLLLNKSAYSASAQRAIVLRHTDPSFIGELKQKLLEEEEMLKKQNASYVFYPIEVKVDPKALQVLLKGDRLVFAASKQVSSQKEGYILHFAYSGTKLFLKSLIPYEIQGD